MSTKIQWSEETWNPVVGCSLKSPGCTNCYAMKMARRLEAMGQKKYVGLTQVVNGNAVWTGEVRMVPAVLRIPVKRQKPTTYFVNSMSDLFHADVPFEFVDRVFAVMAMCPQHTFQVLTKRPERMAEWFAARQHPEHGFDELASSDYVPRAILELGGEYETAASMSWPLPNVWLGTSVENQKYADLRIPHLLRCPAAVRFLSCEPLLGPVELCEPVHYGRAASFEDCGVRSDIASQLASGFKDLDGIHWVICGGESGSSARPCQVAWILNIVRQCQEQGVPVFVKQLGRHPILTAEEMGGECAWPPSDPKGGDMAEWPEALRVRQMPAGLEASR